MDAMCGNLKVCRYQYCIAYRFRILNLYKSGLQVRTTSPDLYVMATSLLITGGLLALMSLCKTSLSSPARRSLLCSAAVSTGHYCDESPSLLENAELGLGPGRAGPRQHTNRHLSMEGGFLRPDLMRVINKKFYDDVNACSSRQGFMHVIGTITIRDRILSLQQARGSTL